MGDGGEGVVSVYAAVYEAVDASLACGMCLPATEARVQRALAQFRRSNSNPEAIRQLESMSVRLHELTAANLRPEEARRRDALAQLNRLAASWMATAPLQ